MLDLGSERLFCDMRGEDTRPGAPDGMKCDIEGNVYCTGPGGIWVINPSGKVIGNDPARRSRAPSTWRGATTTGRRSTSPACTRSTRSASAFPACRCRAAGEAITSSPVLTGEVGMRSTFRWRRTKRPVARPAFFLSTSPAAYYSGVFLMLCFWISLVSASGLALHQLQRRLPTSAPADSRRRQVSSWLPASSGRC